MVEITLPQGETLYYRILLQLREGLILTADDYVVIKVRRASDDLLYQTALPVEGNNEGYFVDWHIPHSKTEKLQKGRHRYGIAVYQNAVLDETGMPYDGEIVEHAIVSEPFNVVPPVAREGIL